MKAPFNTYKSCGGKILPKCPIIANTEEVRNYLKFPLTIFEGSL